MLAEANAETEVLNEAGRLGADTVLEIDSEVEFFEATAKTGAYRCHERAEVSDE